MELPMRYATCHTCSFKAFVAALLCLSGLLPARTEAKSLGREGVRVAQDWVAMARSYRESSILAFHEILTALQMDVTEFANRSGQHEDRLRSYLRGELILDEMELDLIELFVDDVKGIVRKFYNDGLSPNPKASKLLYGVIDAEKFSLYAQIEAAAWKLRESGGELTAEQEQLVNKVNLIRNDAFARLKHGVSLADINLYKNKQQTSTDILNAVLDRLKLSVAELARRAQLDAATVAAYRHGKIAFAVDDTERVYAVLEAARHELSAKPRRKRHRRPRLNKNTHSRAEAELQLKLLLQDFKVAVRVERYLLGR